MPCLPQVLLWNSPDDSSKGSSADEARADRSGHLHRQSPLQKSQWAAGEVLQERSDTCLYEMHTDGPQKPWDCSHGEGEHKDQGEEESVISSNDLLQSFTAEISKLCIWQFNLFSLLYHTIQLMVYAANIVFAYKLWYLLQTQMMKTKAELQHMVQDRIRKCDEIKASVELSKVSDFNVFQL